MREGTIALHTMRRKQLFPTALSNSWTERQAMDGRRNESSKRDDARTAWRDFDRRHYVAFVWRRQRISSNTGLRGPFIGFDMRRCCVSIWLPTHGYALFCWKDDTWIYGKGLVVMYKSFFFFNTNTQFSRKLMAVHKIIWDNNCLPQTRILFEKKYDYPC